MRDKIVAASLLSRPLHVRGDAVSDTAIALVELAFDGRSIVAFVNALSNRSSVSSYLRSILK